MSIIPISQRLKEFMGFTDKDSDQEINKSLKERLTLVCKPCWELKYCPYGPLVEGFPLPPLTRKQHEEHNRYLKNCSESGTMGVGNHKMPLTEEKRNNLDFYMSDKFSLKHKERAHRHLMMCPFVFASFLFSPAHLA